MAKTISCSEVGYFPECSGVMRGETDDEVMQAAAEHGRTAHGMTDEQLRDPETQRTVRSFIREG
jgi:predicted small metal-binding protein